MAWRSVACSARSSANSSLSAWLVPESPSSGRATSWAAIRTSARAVPAAPRSRRVIRVLSNVPPLSPMVVASAYEFVAHSMHRQKKPGLLGDRLELLPKSHDMGVHRARGRIIVVAPDLVE